VPSPVLYAHVPIKLAAIVAGVVATVVAVVDAVVPVMYGKHTMFAPEYP
jgi:hypothetical protein